MNPTRKTKLDANAMAKYGVPPGSEAFLYELDKVIEERCDEFNYILESDGLTIVFEDLEPAAVSIFNYKVIAYR